MALARLGLQLEVHSYYPSPFARICRFRSGDAGVPSARDCCVDVHDVQPKAKAGGVGETNQQQQGGADMEKNKESGVVDVKEKEEDRKVSVHSQSDGEFHKSSWCWGAGFREV